MKKIVLKKFVMKIHFHAEAQLSALTEEKNVTYVLIATTDLTKKIALIAALKNFNVTMVNVCQSKKDVMGNLNAATAKTRSIVGYRVVKIYPILVQLPQFRQQRLPTSLILLPPLY
jgi:hypothetical protein